MDATGSGLYPAEVANLLPPLPGCFSGEFLDVVTLLLLKLQMTYFPNVILNVRAKCSSHDGLDFSS